MTHSQQIELLNKIMPEIASTKSPETVMLKCAKENNLAPAQLEKLAQVFNTAKTLIGLEKQANRGDSFALVDVPALVARYSSYDPSEYLSKDNQKVHNQVNRLTKSASADYMAKAVNADHLLSDGWAAALAPVRAQNELPDLFAPSVAGKVNMEIESDWVSYAPTTLGNFDIMHKSARSAKDGEIRLWESVTSDLRLAEEGAMEVIHGTSAEMQKIAHTVIGPKFRHALDAWPQSVADCVDIMGANAAPVINYMEDYFANNNIRVRTADLTKRAHVPALAYDHNGIMDSMQELYDLMQVRKQAQNVLDAVLLTKEADDKRKSNNPVSGMMVPIVNTAQNVRGVVDDMKGQGIAVPNPTQGLIDDLKNVRGISTDMWGVQAADSKQDAQKEKKKHAERQRINDAETTLTQLMLSDPTIAEADPTAVNDIYQTIYSISPTYATDPMKLGPVMKEALQYDAVPLHVIKDLIAQEKDLADLRLKQKQYEALEYGAGSND